MPNVGPHNAFRFTALPSLRRHYGQKFAWRAHREPLSAKEQPTVTSEDGTRTLRVRTNVSGKESALPLPPLMDPIAMAAKQKYRPSKPYRPRPKPEKMTPFQQALAVNPYAQALATPVRKCTFTQARLPAHFLQPLSAHFRVKDGRLRGYIGSGQPQSEDTLEDEAKGSNAGTAKSKGYVLNSQQVFSTLGRKLQRKRNWGTVVTSRMREAYSARASALSAETGTKVRSNDDWTWMGSEEIAKSILIDGVVEAFEGYMDREPGHRHLLSLEKLRKIPFELVTHPEAWGVAEEGGGDDVVRISPSRLQASEGGVLVPVYDLKDLPVVQRLVTGKLKGTQLASHLEESPVLGILQSRRTLKLQLALQRLAFYSGEMKEGGMCQWVVIREEDWELRKTHEDTLLLGDVLGEPSEGIGDAIVGDAGVGDADVGDADVGDADVGDADVGDAEDGDEDDGTKKMKMLTRINGEKPSS